MFTLVTANRQQRNRFPLKLDWGALKDSPRFTVTHNQRTLIEGVTENMAHGLYLVAINGDSERTIHVHEIIPTCRLYCDVQRFHGHLDTCGTMRIRPVPES